jgi:hypothetical protein
MRLTTRLRNAYRALTTRTYDAAGGSGRWPAAATMPAPVGEALAARGTLAVVGCSVPQIAAVTGHTLASVYSILAKHYLHRNPALAQSAIRRLERITKLPTASQLLDDGIVGSEEKGCNFKGAPSETRTPDPLIKSQLLYQLS